MKPTVTRCFWAETDIMIAYHDDEWGVPVHDDRVLFEFLILEGAQAGLSWETVLNKRDNYRRALAGFHPAKGAPVIQCEHPTAQLLTPHDSQCLNLLGPQ